MRLLASAPVFHRGRAGTGVAVGADQPRRRDRSRRRSSGSSASIATPVAGVRARRPSSRSPNASRAPSTSRRSWPRPATLQEFVATLVARPRRRSRRRDGASSPTWAERLVHDHLAPEARRGEWPEVERRAAEKIEAALARLAGLDAVEAAPGPGGVPAHARARARRRPRARRAPRRRPARWATSRWGSGLDLDRVFVCGLAEGLFPDPRPRRLAPPRRRPARHRRRAPPARPRASTTTTGACSRRWPARRSNACCCSPRRPAPHHRARAVAVPASRASRGRGPGARARRPRRGARRLVHAGTVVRRRPRPGRVPRHRAGAPAPRAARPHACRSPGQRARARATIDVALRRGVETVDGAGRSQRLHALRRQPRGLRRGPRSPTTTSSCRPPGCRPTPPTRSTTSSSTCCGSTSPSCPEERYEVTPLDRGSLVHETLDAFLAEVLARPGGAPAPDTPWTDADRARLREIAEARCAAYEAQGRTGRRLFWHRDQPPHPRRARPVPHRGLRPRAPRSACAPSPPSCASASPTPRPRSTCACPTAACCASAAPPTGSTAPPAARSGSSTTRPAVVRTASTPTTPPPAARCCSSPCTRTRRGRRSATPTRRWAPPTGT